MTSRCQNDLDSVTAIVVSLIRGKDLLRKKLGRERKNFERMAEISEENGQLYSFLFTLDTRGPLYRHRIEANYI